MTSSVGFLFHSRESSEETKGYTNGAVDASSYMTVDDVTRFQYLDNVFNSLCKVRDNKKLKGKG